MSILLRSLSGKETETDISAISESILERNKRVAKTSSIFFLAFVISLFIPIVHFVAVPLCLLLGLIYAIKNLWSVKVKVVGKGVCPECRNDFPVLELTTQFPIRTFCPHCRNQIYIDKR